jgi:flagellar basal body-associated protein FliL
MAETSPLAVGIVGISIPVALIATACVTKSVVVLILAVIAMFCVGAATLSFVLFLASEEPDDEGEPGDAHAPAATNQA